MTETIEEIEETTEEALQHARQAVQHEVLPPALAERRGRDPLIFAASAFVGYLTLLVLVRSNRKIRGDLTTTIYFQRSDHPWLARMMHVVSWFGFRPQSLMLPGSTVCGAWLLGLRLESVGLLLGWLSSLVSFLTKQIVRRPRPDIHGFA